jgi:hypothetical protein
MDEGDYPSPGVRKPAATGNTLRVCMSCLGGEHVGVNLVAGGECESDEDEEWWVGMVRMEGAQEEEIEA